MGGNVLVGHSRPDLPVGEQRGHQVAAVVAGMFAPLTDDLVDDGVDLGLRGSWLTDRAAPPVGRVADEGESPPRRTVQQRTAAHLAEPFEGRIQRTANRRRTVGEVDAEEGAADDIQGESGHLVMNVECFGIVPA